MAAAGLPPAIPLMNASPEPINRIAWRWLVGKTAFAPQILQELQQRQTKDREMVAVDPLEQLNADTLHLIAADARRYGKSGGFDIGLEKAIRELPHGQPGDFTLLEQDGAVARQHNG